MEHVRGKITEAKKNDVRSLLKYLRPQDRKYLKKRLEFCKRLLKKQNLEHFLNYFHYFLLFSIKFWLLFCI